MSTICLPLLILLTSVAGHRFYWPPPRPPFPYTHRMFPFPPGLLGRPPLSLPSLLSISLPQLPPPPPINFKPWGKFSFQYRPQYPIYIYPALSTQPQPNCNCTNSLPINITTTVTTASTTVEPSDVDSVTVPSISTRSSTVKPPSVETITTPSNTDDSPSPINEQTIDDEITDNETTIPTTTTTSTTTTTPAAIALATMSQESSDTTPNTINLSSPITDPPDDQSSPSLPSSPSSASLSQSESLDVNSIGNQLTY